ncbi:MAG: hypothetical protein J5U16_04495, partial [Candidatus Methanoperedens sp.]|nr:hypothetical protein [Candidatus Methanoperedens sp.]
MDIEIAPHVDEIRKALAIEIDSDKLAADLKRLLEFRVPVEEAKRSLIKKYGGGEKSIAKKLKDIAIGDLNIEVTAHILEITKRIITVKKAEKTIFSGILGDETAARSFTAWNDLGLNVGDHVNISQAYVRNWEDRPEVNLGNRSKVIKLSTKIDIAPTGIKKKISDLRDGDVNVESVFTVLKVEFHEINTKDGIKNILNGIAADHNTKVPFTSWILVP